LLIYKKNPKLLKDKARKEKRKELVGYLKLSRKILRQQKRAEHRATIKEMRGKFQNAFDLLKELKAKKTN